MSDHHSSLDSVLSVSHGPNTSSVLDLSDVHLPHESGVSSSISAHAGVGNAPSVHDSTSVRSGSSGSSGSD